MIKRLPKFLIGLLFIFLLGVIFYFCRCASVVTGEDQQQAARTFVFLVPTVLILLGMLSFSIWMWALIDLLAERKLEGTDKIVWALVIILLNVLGGILYFLVLPFLRDEARSSGREIDSELLEKNQEA
ncbi:MAG: PLD nuclease N-terminal domain-containing protein [Verrucomicrobiota bacterium]